MKIHVDAAVCLLHGQCVIAAPQVFSFNEDGSLAWAADCEEALRGAVEAAADACPEQAITIDT